MSVAFINHMFSKKFFATSIVLRACLSLRSPDPADLKDTRNGSRSGSWGQARRRSE